MERKSLERRIRSLLSFKNNLNKKRHIQECSDNCIEYICEACHNILRGNIDLSDKLRTKLKKHKKLVRQLANPKPKTSIKRKLLVKTQVGEGLFPVIINSILPYLINLLKNKKNVYKHRN